MQVFQIPALTDNYIYILREEQANLTAVVDPALEGPVTAFLKKKQWKLDYILNTHHHPDHVGGNQSLQKIWQPQTAGFAPDAPRIPGINKLLNEGDIFHFGPHKACVLFLPGHTLGHIAYWFSSSGMLFCGDTLFAMGCGRLFEGSPQQMFNSLQKIKSLPPETKIYCTHEYTEQNGRFALTVAPQNPALKARMQEVLKKRKRNQPTVPFLLSDDLKTNPFLMAETPERFAQLRQKKDHF